MDIILKFIILFFIYSFIGWIIETVYCSLMSKRLINRGFLKGPYCPMYGFSALIIIEIIKFFVLKIQISGVLYFMSVFLISTIIATAVEFLTGLFIDKVFKMKLWDYSDRSFNIKGYVCLQFSLYWGFLAFFLLMIINKIFDNLASYILITNYKYIFLVFLVLIIIDFGMVLRSLIIFNRIVDKINILKIDKLIKDFNKYKRILRNFVPNFYSLDNKKLNKLKEKITKTILRR